MAMPKIISVTIEHEHTIDARLKACGVDVSTIGNGTLAPEDVRTVRDLYRTHVEDIEKLCILCGPGSGQVLRELDSALFRCSDPEKMLNVLCATLPQGTQLSPYDMSKIFSLMIVLYLIRPESVKELQVILDKVSDTYDSISYYFFNCLSKVKDIVRAAPFFAHRLDLFDIFLRTWGEHTQELLFDIKTLVTEGRINSDDLARFFPVGSDEKAVLLNTIDLYVLIDRAGVSGWFTQARRCNELIAVHPELRTSIEPLMHMITSTKHCSDGALRVVLSMVRVNPACIRDLPGITAKFKEMEAAVGGGYLALYNALEMLVQFRPLFAFDLTPYIELCLKARAELGEYAGLALLLLSESIKARAYHAVSPEKVLRAFLSYVDIPFTFAERMMDQYVYLIQTRPELCDNVLYHLDAFAQIIHATKLDTCSVVDFLLIARLYIEIPQVIDELPCLVLLSKRFGPDLDTVVDGLLMLTKAGLVTAQNLHESLEDILSDGQSYFARFGLNTVGG